MNKYNKPTPDTRRLKHAGFLIQLFIYRIRIIIVMYVLNEKIPTQLRPTVNRNADNIMEIRVEF